MGFKTLLNLATLGLVAAEASVVSLFIFHADPQSLVGSAVATVSASPYQTSIPSSIRMAFADMQYLYLECWHDDVQRQLWPRRGITRLPIPSWLYTAGPKTVEWSLKYPYDS